MDMMDPKQKVIQELMAYLDSKDGQELGDAMKPKGMGLEVTKIQGLGGDKDKDEPDSDDSPGVMAGSDAGGMGDDGKPKMSDDDMDELIQAIQSKIGA